MKILIFIFLLLCFGVSDAQTPAPVSNDTITVTNAYIQLVFHRKKATVVLTPLDHFGHNADRYEITWMSLREKNSQGMIVRDCAFGPNTTYSDVEVDPRKQIKSIAMTSFVVLPDNKGSASLQIKYFLFQNSTFVYTTGGRLKLFGGSLHFSMTCNDWPFLANGNTLDVRFELSSSATNLTSFGSEPDNAQIMFVKVVNDNDDFIAKLPKVSNISLGNNVSLADVGINVMLSIRSSSIGVTLGFPQFSTLYYDGVIVVDQVTPWAPFKKPVSGLPLIVFLSLSAAFLVLFGIITAYFHWRREGEKSAIRYH